MHDNSDKYDVIAILNDEIAPMFILYALESILLHICTRCH